jgi:hypothetical protein
MANCQDKELGPFDVGHVSAGSFAPFTFRNRFDELSHLSNDDMHRLDEDLPTTAGTPSAQQPRKTKPLPIYMHGVTNYQDMVSYLTATLEEEQYYCKAFPDERSKSTYTPLILTVGWLNNSKPTSFTIPAAGRTSLRSGPCHLHHSIHPDVIKGELEGLGHTARNVLNIRHRLTKASLPLFCGS